MLLKRVKCALLALVLALPGVALPQSTPFVSGSITTQNLVPAGVATAGSSVEVVVAGESGFAVQVTGTYTGALSVQVTVDSVNWVTLAAATAINNVAAGTAAATITTGQVGAFSVNTPGVTRARVTALAAVTGTAVVSIRTSRASKIN